LNVGTFEQRSRSKSKSGFLTPRENEGIRNDRWGEAEEAGMEFRPDTKEEGKERCRAEAAALHKKEKKRPGHIRRRHCGKKGRVWRVMEGGREFRSLFD